MLHGFDVCHFCSGGISKNFCHSGVYCVLMTLCKFLSISILLMWNQPPDNIINCESPDAWPCQPEGSERAEKIPKFLRGQIARFKVVHDLQSGYHKSLPDLGDLTAEEDAQLLMAMHLNTQDSQMSI